MQWDLGQGVHSLGATLSAKGRTDSRGSPLSGRLHCHGAGVLLHSLVRKESRIRCPNMPEKHLLHGSSDQVMKTINNNSAASVLKSPLPGRSFPVIPLNLTSFPSPQGNARWSAEPVFARDGQPHTRLCETALQGGSHLISRTERLASVLRRRSSG